MKTYDALWADVRSLDASVSLLADRQQWHNRRTIPSGIEERGRAHFARIIDENEGVKRMVAVSKLEGERMLGQLLGEERERCVLAAGVNLRELEPKFAELRKALKDYVEQRRHDVNLSFADALDGLDAGDMVTLALLTETLRPTFETAAAVDLESRYVTALAEQDAAGLVTARLIEQRVKRGGLAQTATDLEAVKHLAEHVAAVQAARVEPIEEIAKVEETLKKAQRAVSMAATAQVRPIAAERDSAARDAFKREAELFAQEAAR